MKLKKRERVKSIYDYKYILENKENISPNKLINMNN